MGVVEVDRHVVGIRRRALEQLVAGFLRVLEQHRLIGERGNPARLHVDVPGNRFEQDRLRIL